MLIVLFIFRYSGIIKEEELERMDQIVKEDGWVQDDEIDYNQKLVFSDDDSEATTARNRDIKRVNFNDRDKETRRKDELEMRASKFQTQIISSLYIYFVSEI